MSETPRGDAGSEALETPLRAVDPDLNVFALANGLDLHRNLSGRPDRVLEWYRDGMERFLHLEPDEDGASFVLWAEAVSTRGGESRRTRRDVESGVPAEGLARALRPLLARGIEEANALSASDLGTPDRESR